MAAPQQPQSPDPRKEAARQGGTWTEEEKTRGAMPEELIAAATGLTESMGPEEVDRRIGVLVGELGILERGRGIRRHLRSAKE